MEATYACVTYMCAKHAQRLTVGHLPDSTHLTDAEQQYSTYITAVLGPQLRTESPGLRVGDADQ